MNEKKPLSKPIRFDFPPGMPPEDIAKAIREQAEKSRTGAKADTPTRR